MSNKLIKNFICKKNNQGLLRQKILFKNNKIKINFTDADYLALKNNPQLKNAFIKGMDLYPVGSGSSLVAGGYQHVHKKLETAFCEVLNTDDALLFSSGYCANLAVVALCSHLQLPIVIDKNIHASFYDGLSLNKTTFKRFSHNNLLALTKKLAEVSQAFVCTEGIFSMSGQQPKLDEMHSICKKFKSYLIIDEAHSFGVIGKNGMGAAALNNLTQEQVPLRIIPFGKALCAQGAMVAGQKDWVKALLQVSRSLIYSTAYSPALAFGMLTSLQVLQTADEERAKISELINYFKKSISSSTLDWLYSDSQIQFLRISCPHFALKCADFLLEKGIFCIAMRVPTVNKSDTGIRFILNASHNFTDIDFLFDLLKSYHEKLNSFESYR